MKILKYLFYTILTLVVLAALGIGGFIYKAKKGINFYETKPHILDKSYGENSILVISKTNAFRHGEAIKYSRPILEEIAAKNNWEIYQTEDAGIFNKEQLSLFNLVVCNNCSGKIMNAAQRQLFKKYINDGGGFVGIHAAGDGSHRWDWYADTLIGARFSHHPIKYHIQQGKLMKDSSIDSAHHFNFELPDKFSVEDEWYVFYDSPRENNVNILYTLDETGLDWDGRLGPFFKDKTFGMGDDHPIVWYKDVGQGRSFYTAMGHDRNAWTNDTHKSILEQGISWAGNFK